MTSSFRSLGTSLTARRSNSASWSSNLTRSKNNSMIWGTRPATMHADSRLSWARR